MAFTLNKRQDLILNWLSSKEEASIAEILQVLHSKNKSVVKMTVNRDLNELIKRHFIIRQGKGRKVTYALTPEYQLIRPVDVEAYFKKESDEREAMERFNFGIFDHLEKIFTQEEKAALTSLHQNYQNHLASFPALLKEKEFERLMIEFSWKSSRIEGNTYTLLETERLLKDHEEAPGHKAEEATMILNHKVALDYVRKHPQDYRTLSIAKIEDIHALLIKHLPVAKGLRKKTVGIVGTRYKPLDNLYQIREALEKMVECVNRETGFFEKALLASLLIAYIQPFEDGNKRTSRMIANAILLAHDSCPLSYRSANEVEYKKAVILFYEKNNLHYFKQLFMEQFEFAVKNYFVS